jgi:CheY-like chemotaxis protein
MSTDATRAVFTLLVADDDPAIVAMLRVLFEHDGHRVLAAREGAEAVQCCHEDNVDLAILDVELSGMNGVEVAKALRSSSQTFSIPIVFCTACPELVPPRFSETARDNVRVVPKPFELGALREAVLGLLSLQQATRDVFTSASPATMHE